MTAIAAVLLGVGVVTAGASQPRPEPPIERLQWAREVDGPQPITALEVRNDFGDIRARAAGDRRLEAWMVVQRLDRAGERLGFTVERRGGVVALVVGYPPGRVKDSDPHPPKDSYDRLDLVVYVPKGVTLRAQTLRGQVEVRRLKSDVEATTLDGPVLLAASGSVRARTAGGEVTALIDDDALATEGPPLLLESESGAIHVTLPARGEAELRVETAGLLSTKLPVLRSQAGGRTRATLASASAKRLLLVRSGSGAVTIERDEP